MAQIEFTFLIEEFKSGRNQNELTSENIEKIISTYIKRVDVEKYAHVASLDEIIENDYNLNIPRYVNSIEEEEEVDISDTKAKLIDIEKRKKIILDSINKTLDILGL